MKDAKGHGSEARGRGSYGNIDKNMRGAGKHVGYGGGDTFHIQKSNGPKSNWYSAVGQNTKQSFSGKGLGEISTKLSGLQHVAGIAAAHDIPTGHLDYGPGHTVSQITLGGKVKNTLSAAEYARRGNKFD